MSLCSAFIITNTAFAQPGYRFTNYTQENGIASSTLTGITKDSTGFLWLLSENGLTRFDGYDFKVYRNNPSDTGSISSPYVIGINIDSQKNIFVRTSNSLSKYNQQTNSFNKIILLNDSNNFLNWIPGYSNQWILLKGNLAQLNGKTNTCLFYPYGKQYAPSMFQQAIETENDIFIFGGAIILKFNKKDKKFIPVSIDYSTANSPQNSGVFLAFFQNPDKNIGMYTTSGFYLYNKTTNTFLKKSQSSFGNVSGYDFSGKLVKPSGWLFAAKRNGTIFLINTISGTERVVNVKNFCAEHLKSDFAVAQIYDSPGNTIWVSTLSSGIFKLNTETLVAEHFYFNSQNTNTLASNGSNFIFDDNNGVVWISLPGIGLAKGEHLKQVFSTHVPTASSASLKKNIRNITEYSGNQLLILTLDGCYLFNKHSKTFSYLTNPENLKPLPINGALSDAAFDSDSNLWIASWRGAGLFGISNKKKKFITLNPLPDSLPHQSISLRCLYFDSKNNLWLGSADNAIFRLNTSQVNFNNPSNTKFEIFNSKVLNNRSLTFGIVFSITENKNGDIIFATQNGLYFYSYITKTFQNYPTASNSNKLLSNEDVRVVYIDSKNNLWAGTNGGGLNRYNQADKSFTSFTTQNGLPDNIIYSILEDNDGFLWLGTNKGLCRFDDQKLLCRNYSPKDGIQNYEFNTNSTCKTASGQLVFGGVNGFNVFYPDSIEVASAPPKVIITSFKVGDREKNSTARVINLPHNQNYLSFEFAALNYFRNSENVFAYMLQGIDKDWVYCGTRRFTSYPNLSPGSYTFKVKAANCYGEWNQAQPPLVINIATPWYSSLLFRLTIIIVASAIIYIVFRIRLYQKLKVQEVRNKIARDLHDEIGSNLSSISLFSEVAKEKAGTNNNPITPLLKKISEYTQSSQEAMNDIVWMINARNDNFENIIVRMRALAAEMFEAKNINLHLNFHDKLNHVKLGMDERKNFYLIYKEAINNIMKYAQCKNVWIDLWLLHNTIYLRIKDDGKGFDTSIKYIGNGLNNMQKRTENLNGKLKILSQPNSGTLIEVQFTI